MKKNVRKKLLIFCMLFFSVFFVLVPNTIFAAKPGEYCKGDMDCAETKGSICIPAIGNLCGGPGDGCTTDKDCTVSGEQCNTAKRLCEATKSAPSCPSGKPYNPKLGLCSEPASTGPPLGACCVGTTPGKAEPDCIGVYANVTNCDDVKKSGATYTLQNKPCSQVAACPSTTIMKQPPASTKDTYTFTPIEPKLQIDIPTVKFSKITKEGQELGIPYLAEYIAGVYKYAVAIGSIVAIVMIMVGGLRWMTAGGSASAIDAAKSRISNAVIGLILLLGSYTVLYTINPDLVSFRALKIELIQRIPLEIAESSDEAYELISPQTKPSAKNLVNIKGGLNMSGRIRGKAVPELVSILHASAAALASKGCTVVYASGHRTGKDQFSNIPSRCQWSEQYKTYINCKMAMGIWGSTLDKPKSTTCKYQDRKTPLSPCNLDDILHYDAIDMWAAPTNTTKTCGNSKQGCIKDKCQRELTRIMNQNGACVLLGKNWQSMAGAFEPWHFQLSGGGCYKDADAKYNSLGGQGY